MLALVVRPHIMLISLQQSWMAKASNSGPS